MGTIPTANALRKARNARNEAALRKDEAALRKARNEAGLTLQELSEKSGVALETISRLENDEHKPQAKTLKKLAGALGIPVSDLAVSLNRVEVFVGGRDQRDGLHYGERINFRGENRYTVESKGGDRTDTLFKCPNGYRVYVIDDLDASLHPTRKNPDTGETEYPTYATAEDLVKDFPEFAPVVGNYPVRYLD